MSRVAFIISFIRFLAAPVAAWITWPNNLKDLVYIFNVLTCAAGWAVAGVGLCANTDDKFTETLKKLISDYYLNVDVGQIRMAIWFLVGVGTFLFFTGLLGMCGAIRENKWLLRLFCVIVLVLFLAGLGAGIATFVMKDKFRSSIEEVLKESFIILESSSDKHMLEAKMTLISIQKELQCCGIRTMNGQGQPPSAYRNLCAESCTVGKLDCVTVIWYGIRRNALIAGGVAVGVLIIELLAMIFSFMMSSAIAD